MEWSEWCEQTEWPKWCKDHQRSMLVWCLDCIAPVCEKCAGGLGAHGSHLTSSPDLREDCATQSSFLSESAVGYWENRTVLLEKMVGAMDGEVRVRWGTGGYEGMAWLEGTFGGVVNLEHAMKKEEMRDKEARNGKGGVGHPGVGVPRGKLARSKKGKKKPIAGAAEIQSKIPECPVLRTNNEENNHF